MSFLWLPLISPPHYYWLI